MVKTLKRSKLYSQVVKTGMVNTTKWSKLYDQVVKTIKLSKKNWSSSQNYKVVNFVFKFWLVCV